MAHVNQADMKMFASLERKIFIPLTGKEDDTLNVYNILRESGARVAMPRIDEVIRGKVDNVRGFEVLTLTGHKEIQPHQRRRTREYEPNGDPVKSIKRGTVYGTIMTMMVKGATMAELLAVTGNSTEGGISVVIGSKIREMGYGVSFDKGTGKYKIVFPEGVKELTYHD